MLPLFAILFTACAAGYIRIGPSSPDFSIGEIKTAKSILLVSEKAEVKQFKKSFARAFGSGSSLSGYLSKALADSLNAIPGVSVSVGPAGISDSLAGDSVSKSATFFEGVEARYALNVKNILIYNSTQYTPGIMAPSGPGGSMVVTGGGISTSCVVSYDVEIWDVPSMTRMALFQATGTAQVFMFFYRTALENAVESSLRHFVAYVREGRTER